MSLSEITDNSVDNKTTYIVHTDGGSRGNPGPSAAAFVVATLDGQDVLAGGEYIGITTNSQAEYIAVLLALEALRKKVSADDRVTFNIDSLLVVNQLNGQYSVKNRDLWPVHQKILDMLPEFGEVTFRHVPRENNSRADAAVNEILDAHHV